ncbi:transposase [Holospora undulata]|uniref:Tc1-like transposase DDE domain-containing protein n=1 Tax=Holospora undulata HU1 TaxID=1321371 RepID=A0A061JFL3_9PROT|nr:transposase [Holospora undulata]ETZ04335.1 hypothetical protein K737_301255 [Holospora undulata HU1]ETZ04786.1 hypothetical protein K737_300799 [Holospora undulata HU1]ETZ05306.1 hypothetical protein K737_300255 [Holospora undulata HU1]
MFGDGAHPTMTTKITCQAPHCRRLPTRMNPDGRHMRLTVVSLKNLEDVFYQLKDAYPKAPNIHLILDQRPYNTSKNLQKTAKERGIEVHYLPSL